MAAKRKGSWGNVKPSSMRMQGSDSPSVHFFKIILPSTLHDQKLKLPKKFGKKFGNELSAIATITVPNGRIWQLGLQKTEGRILFVDGWQEFVEYHSIDSGYFLVFRYQGFSKFHVCIFDKTATEIDYHPWNAPSNDVEPHFDKESSEDHDGDGDDGDGDGDGDDDEDDDVEDDDVEISKPKNAVSFNEFIDKLMFASKHLSRFKMSMQSKRAIHAARSCKCTRPSFIVILHKYNKHLYVPTEFVMKYMQSCSEIITLEAFNGKQWHVSCSLKDRRSSNTRRLSKGWRGFVRDNNLKAGDVCVFELIKQKDTLLKVSIYYAKKCSK